MACVYCEKGIEDGIQFTLDHVVPQDLGGSNETKNLVTACKTCNSAKGSKSTRQFFAYLAKKGVDTAGISKRIQRNVRRKLSNRRWR